MSLPGTLHRFYDKLVAFEHAPSSGPYSSKIILFVGGLGDGISTVAYLKQLVPKVLEQGWGFVEMLTSSSWDGWGNGSLTRDGDEIAAAVQYLREKCNKTTIVLCGHSTGCQDLMYYTTQSYPGARHPDIASRPRIDGLILQAGVSDREAFLYATDADTWKKALADGKEVLAKDLELFETEKKLNPNAVPKYTMMPAKDSHLFFAAPVNSYRWVSMIDVRGDDDYFSSDLDASDFAKTFGKITVPLLVLYSGCDEFVPEFVDKERLMKQFEDATDKKYWSPHSHVIAKAGHFFRDSPQEAYNDLLESVSSFLSLSF